MRRDHFKMTAANTRSTLQNIAMILLFLLFNPTSMLVSTAPLNHGQGFCKITEMQEYISCIADVRVQTKDSSDEPIALSIWLLMLLAEIPLLSESQSAFGQNVCDVNAKAEYVCVC